MVENRVYRNCPIMFPNRGTPVDLVEIDMLDFNTILGMDWLHTVLLPLIFEQELSSQIFQMNKSLERKGGIILL